MSLASFLLPFSAPVAVIGCGASFVDIGQTTPVPYSGYLLGTGRVAVGALVSGDTAALAMESPYAVNTAGMRYTQLDGVVGLTVAGQKLVALLVATASPYNIDLILGLLNANGVVVQWGRHSELASATWSGNALQVRYIQALAPRNQAGQLAVLWPGLYADGVQRLMARTLSPTTTLDMTGTGLVQLKAPLGGLTMLAGAPIGSTFQHTWVGYLVSKRFYSFVWHADDTVTTTWADTFTSANYEYSKFDFLPDPLVSNAGWVILAMRQTTDQDGYVMVVRLTNIDNVTPTVGAAWLNRLGYNQVAYHVGISLGNLHSGPGPNRLVIGYTSGTLSPVPTAVPLYQMVLNADLTVPTGISAEQVPLGNIQNILAQSVVASNGLLAVQYGVNTAEADRGLLAAAVKLANQATAMSIANSLF